MANGNGNGWIKQILVGIGIIVVSAAIVGSASNTFSNSVAQRGLEVKVSSLEKEVVEQGEVVSKVDVMDERIKDIKDDVRKILAVLAK